MNPHFSRNSTGLFAAVWRGLAVALACAVQAQEAPLLTTAEAVRALPAAEAAQGRAVRVRGVVTFLAPTPQLFFLEDETGAVAVTGPREKPVKVGARVEIDGVTAAPGPVVTGRRKEPVRVTFLEDGALPEPRAVTPEELREPAAQGVRVELACVVRAVRAEALGPSSPEALVLTLAVGPERVTALVLGWKGGGVPESLIGANVRARGVFNPIVFEKQPLLGGKLLLNGLKDLLVDQPARGPFDPPIDSIAAAREPGAFGRLHTRGSVTLAAPGRGMYVENQSGGIWVEHATPPTVGARVEVAGFPASREGEAVLEDAIWRSGEREVPIRPPLITAEEALSGRHDGRLVRIEALLLASSSTADGQTLVLQSGERVFLARGVSPATRLPSLPANGWLRVTGVCVNDRAEELRGESFHLVLGGPEAVEISGAPSWWTLRRIFGVIGALAFVAAAGFAWAVTLGRRVARQTEEIREHLAREAVAEERVRIARELHDSLQQDLVGITMQLKATDRLIDDPEKARAALQLASAMVRRSQAETHRAIWDLRDRGAEHPHLVATLREVLATLSTDGSPAVEVSGTGHLRPLPAAVENHVLRIAQEAVTNALKHAVATRIEVELDYGVDRVTLLVRDDGRGFDADHPPAAATGHFGLFGMRERAAKLGADLRITSRANAGSAVQLTVPLHVEPLENHPTQIASALHLSQTTP